MSRTDEKRRENEERNHCYTNARADLADRIERCCGEILKRKWKPPDRAGCLWLADAVLVIRNRAKAYPATAEMDAVIDTGRRFVTALRNAGLVNEAVCIQHAIPYFTNRGRDPFLFLAEQTKKVISETNDGNFPTSTEKNGPLVKLVSALFDLTKVEPGQIPAATVADVLSGNRRAGAL